MNGLSNSGAQALAEALLVNNVLAEVDVTCNRIFDEGAAHIARALCSNDTLRTLRVCSYITSSWRRSWGGGGGGGVGPGEHFAYRTSRLHAPQSTPL